MFNKKKDRELLALKRHQLRPKNSRKPGPKTPKSLNSIHSGFSDQKNYLTVEDLSTICNSSAKKYVRPPIKPQKDTPKSYKNVVSYAGDHQPQTIRVSDFTPTHEVINIDDILDSKSDIKTNKRAPMDRKSGQDPKKFESDQIIENFLPIKSKPNYRVIYNENYGLANLDSQGWLGKRDVSRGMVRRGDSECKSKIFFVVENLGLIGVRV